MGAGAALFPDRVPQWRPRRNRLALALTAGLHLLLAWFWLQARRPLPVPAAGPQVVSILLQLPAGERRRAPAPVSAPAPAPEPPPLPHAATPAYPAPPRTGLPPPAAATPTRPPSAAPAPPSTPPAADPLALPQSAPATTSLARDPAAAADGSFTAGLGARQAGRIDHELRGGKSGVPVEADTPWGRFQRGLEAAHVERSMSVIEDSYTSPDGVVIYRQRIGSRVFCRRTGSVGLGIAGAVNVNDAGPVTCPSGVTWKRED